MLRPGDAAGSSLDPNGEQVSWNEPALPMAWPAGMPADQAQRRASPDEGSPEDELRPQPDPSWPRLFARTPEGQDAGEAGESSSDQAPQDAVVEFALGIIGAVAVVVATSSFVARRTDLGRRTPRRPDGVPAEEGEATARGEVPERPEVAIESESPMTLQGPQRRPRVQRSTGCRSWTSRQEIQRVLVELRSLPSQVGEPPGRGVRALEWQPNEPLQLAPMRPAQRVSRQLRERRLGKWTCGMHRRLSREAMFHVKHLQVVVKGWSRNTRTRPSRMRRPLRFVRP